MTALERGMVLDSVLGCRATSGCCGRADLPGATCTVETGTLNGCSAMSGDCCTGEVAVWA